MLRKLIIGLLIIALFAAGAVVVFAQDGDDPTPPYGRGRMMGRGIHEQVAGALGVDVETFWNELQAGKTIAELAAEQGVELDTVSAAITAEMTEHLNTMVEEGYITQAQADEHLAYMTENLEAHLNGDLMFGMGFGRGGMMGRGGCPMGNHAHRGHMGGGMGRRWGPGA